MTDLLRGVEVGVLSSDSVSAGAFLGSFTMNVNGRGGIIGDDAKRGQTLMRAKVWLRCLRRGVHAPLTISLHSVVSHSYTRRAIDWRAKSLRNGPGSSR